MAIIEGEKNRIYKKVTTKSMTAVRMSLLEIIVRVVIDVLLCLLRNFILLQFMLDPERLSTAGILTCNFSYTALSGFSADSSSRGSTSSSFCVISICLFLSASRRLFLRFPSIDECRSSRIWSVGGSALTFSRIVAWRKFSDLLFFLAFSLNIYKNVYKN